MMPSSHYAVYLPRALMERAIRFYWQRHKVPKITDAVVVRTALVRYCFKYESKDESDGC